MFLCMVTYLYSYSNRSETNSFENGHEIDVDIHVSFSLPLAATNITCAFVSCKMFLTSAHFFPLQKYVKPVQQKPIIETAGSLGEHHKTSGNTNGIHGIPSSSVFLDVSSGSQISLDAQLESFSTALHQLRGNDNLDNVKNDDKQILMENAYFKGDVDGKTLYDAANVAGIPGDELSQNSQNAFDKAVQAKMGSLHVAEEAEEKMAVYHLHDMERAASTGDCPERSKRGGFVDSRPELSEERQAWAKKVVASVHATSKPIIAGSETLLRIQRCAETCAVACAPCESAGSVLSFLSLSSEQREKVQAREHLYARTAISMAGYGLAQCEHDCMSDCQRHAGNAARTVDKTKPSPEVDCHVCVDKFSEAGGCKAFKDHDMQKAEEIVKSIDPKCMSHQCGELAVKRCNVTSMFDDFQKPHEEKVSQHMAMLEEHEALQSAAAGLLAMMQKQKAKQTQRVGQLETPQHAYRNHHSRKKNLRGDTGHGETMPGAVGFGPASKDPLEDAAKAVEERRGSKHHSHMRDVRFQGVGARLHTGAKTVAKAGAKAKHVQGVKAGSDPWWLNPPPWWLPPPPEWGSPPPSIYSPFYSPYGGTSQGMHASAAHNAYPAYSPTPLPY